jgi:single-stranded DNA-binding protein
MHSITGKMNKDATQFQAGESTGFGIRLGVKYRDPKTKVDAWTNYSAVIFAKSQGQIQFYQSVLVEGAIVAIGAEQLKIDSFDGQNGQALSIDMLNARLTYAHNPNSHQAPQQQGGYGQQAAPQQQRPPAQPAYNQAPPQQQPRSQSPNYGGFDDDVPM